MTQIRDALTIYSDTTYYQIVTPANPASGYIKFYAKSDGNIYTLSSTGVEYPHLPTSIAVLEKFGVE